MTNLCVEIDQYTNRVLGVIKGKYGLKDKGQAVNKFAELHGDEFVEKDVSEDVVAEAIAISSRHLKKYGIRKMKDKELDALFNA
jgi:hypothetical protein